MPLSFELTPKQEKLQAHASKFAEKWIAPRAAEIDGKNEVPADLIERMYGKPYRYSSIYIPKKYGGTGLDMLTIYLITEEIAYANATCATLLEVPGITSMTILNGGTEVQKKRFLPPLARGEKFFAFALSEPAAGTDAASIVTRAEKRGKEYVLNGRKHLISFADIADFFVVFAKTDVTKGARGISAFVVEKGTGGFTIGREQFCMGMHGHRTWEISFKNCSVPRENLLGSEGEGFRYAMRTLDDTRATISGIFVGLARAALDVALKYANARKTFGRKLAEHQFVSFSLAEVARNIDAARLLSYRACWLADNGIAHKIETAMAKSLASEVVLKATDAAMEILGGIGTTKEYPVERYYRDARTFIFAQGSPEAQRMLIGRGLLKKLEASASP